MDDDYEYYERNTWFRLTLVYDSESTTGEIYQDDAPYPMKSEAVSSQSNTGQMVLGRGFTNVDDDYAYVLIDNLKMWNRKLTREEILQLN